MFWINCGKLNWHRVQRILSTSGIFSPDWNAFPNNRLLMDAWWLRTSPSLVLLSAPQLWFLSSLENFASFIRHYKSNYQLINVERYLRLKIARNTLSIAIRKNQIKTAVNESRNASCSRESEISQWTQGSTRRTDSGHWGLANWRKTANLNQSKLGIWQLTIKLQLCEITTGYEMQSSLLLLVK